MKSAFKISLIERVYLIGMFAITGFNEMIYPLVGHLMNSKYESTHLFTHVFKNAGIDHDTKNEVKETWSLDKIAFLPLMMVSVYSAIGMVYLWIEFYLYALKNDVKEKEDRDGDVEDDGSVIFK